MITSDEINEYFRVHIDPIVVRMWKDASPELDAIATEDAYREMNKANADEIERASKEYASDNQEPV